MPSGAYLLLASVSADFVIRIANEKESPDVSQRWQGYSTEHFSGQLQALRKVKLTVFAEYTMLYVAGRDGHALMFTIEKSAKLHRTLAKDVYQRQGAQSLKLSGDQIHELSFGKKTNCLMNCRKTPFCIEADSPHEAML